MQGDVQAHRCVNPLTVELYHPTISGFSNFQFLEDTFGSFVPNRDGAVRRCFSLARMSRAKTLVREMIDPVGMLLYEHQQLSRTKTAVVECVFRFSFWRRFFLHKDEIKSLSSDDCLGYAIIQEIKLATGERRWNVFEAVFQPVLKSNWVIPRLGVYDFNVGGCSFCIRGNLYCQQDGLSTVCAHVALRTLISRVSPKHDISYKTIDDVARKVCDINLELGLTIQQIEAVLDDAHIEYEDFCYDRELICDKGKSTFISDDTPIERFIHAGVESGMGSLFGFKVECPETIDRRGRSSEMMTDGIKTDSRHIIPIFGHSFNGLSWINEAGRRYFRKNGASVLYTTGTCWTDGYLGHDDNVGPEVFIPQNYVRTKYHSYVLNLLKPSYHSTGVFVEDIARELLETYLGSKLPQSPSWSRRLCHMVRNTPTEIVYRAVSMTRCDYCKWLAQARDWAGMSESESDCLALEDELPSQLWIVEISCPHLYPGNLRKIGDMIFDAEKIKYKNKPHNGQNRQLFVLARFPSLYMLHPKIAVNSVDKNDKVLVYQQRASRICSHTPCITIGVGNVVSNV